MQRRTETQALAKRILVGSTLRRATYEQLTRGGLTGMQAGLIHEVDTAIYLEFDAAWVCVTWNHFDRSESLDVYSTVAPISRGEDLVTIDVSEDPNWSSLMHKQVSGLRFGWNYGEPGGPDDLWSVRLLFHGGGFVVLCMGELDSRGEPIGSAEGLLAIFDELAARNLRTAGSRGSAWAEDADHGE